MTFVFLLLFAILQIVFKMTKGEEIPSKATRSIEDQVSQLREVASGKQILIVLDDICECVRVVLSATSIISCVSCLPVHVRLSSSFVDVHLGGVSV